MSDTKKDGGPAFPHSALTPRGPEMYSDAVGMSLRDYFAAHAMSAYIAKVPLMTCIDQRGLFNGSPRVDQDEAVLIRAAVAEVAYAYADAMLAAREGR